MNHTILPGLDPTSSAYNNSGDGHYTILADNMFTVIFQMGVGISACCFNVLILTALPRWKSVYYNVKILLCNLAVSDILSSFLLLVRNGLMYVEGETSSIMCLYLTASIVAFMVTDLVFICIIAVINMMALDPTVKIMSRSIHITCGVTWIVCFAFQMVGVWTAKRDAPTMCFFGNSWYSRVFLTVFFLSITATFLIMISAQTKVLIYIRKNTANNSVVPIADGANVAHGSEQRLKRLIKVNNIMMLVMGIGILTYIPYITVLGMHLFSGLVQERHLMLFAGILLFNCVTNIFVYSIRSVEFRQALKNSIIFAH